MIKLLKTLALAPAFAATLFGAAFAQSDAPTAESDPVFVFNRVCYTQVPRVSNIQDMAVSLAWMQMSDEDLRQFTNEENPDLLQGWDVSIAERLYRLGIVQSGLNDKFKEAFPDFADGQATSCSLVLDGSDHADVIFDRVMTLARKEPVSKNVAEGDQLTSTWAGGNDDFKVFLFYKSDTKGNANLINVTILSKEKS